MTKEEILTQIKITIVDVVENCNDAYVSGGAAHDEAIEAYEQVAEYIDELFDEFESRTCKSCKHHFSQTTNYGNCERNGTPTPTEYSWFCAGYEAKDDI